MADDTYTSIPCDVKTLEFQKFDLDADGKVIVKTSATGVFKPSGLNVAGRFSLVTLSDASWTALPVSPLSNRNAMSIQNQSGVEIKVNYDSGVATYTGVTIPAGGERFYDITDDIVIYAKASSGSPVIGVEEIS